MRFIFSYKKLMTCVRLGYVVLDLDGRVELLQRDGRSAELVVASADGVVQVSHEHDLSGHLDEPVAHEDDDHEHAAGVSCGY
jgi:hypothetical protein